jgi:hypothetical protein
VKSAGNRRGTPPACLVFAHHTEYAVDLDSIFFMRTPAGDRSHADPRITMSPAFRRMLGEPDGKKSLAALAKVFSQLDAEDLRPWVSELVRQKLIKRAPTLTVSRHMRLAQLAAKVEKQLNRIAEKIEPWLEGRGRMARHRRRPRCNRPSVRNFCAPRARPRSRPTRPPLRLAARVIS